VEYKREAFHMFEELLGNIKSDIAHAVFRATASIDTFQHMVAQNARRQRLVHDDVHLLGAQPAAAAVAGRQPSELPAGAAEGFDAAMEALSQPTAAPVPVRRDQPKVGRNDLCPCGSGKKSKKCCGA
jgi:preprotein translocase subunit SecA